MSLGTKFLFSASLAAMMVGGAAVAQTETDSDSDAEADRRLSIVTVTSQKREQSLQDVPVVVTALGTEALEDAGVRDIKDLTVLTPGLIVTSSSSSSDTTARIRGVGTVGNNPGLESSVAISIDGVGRARNGVAFGDLGEIERIEVLKGPQGSLFGKSSSAGVINIITKGPEDEFSGEVAATVGNLDHYRVSGSVTGPLSDTARGRLFGVYAERGSSFDTVTTGQGPRTDTDSDTYQFFSLRGQLEFDLAPNATLKLIGDYTDREENCCLAEYIARDPGRGAVIDLLAGGQGAGNDGDPFGRDAFANRDSVNNLEEYGISAELDWGLSFGDLTSVTSFRNWENGRSEDTDWSTADIWYRVPDGQLDEYQNFTQEFRLAGETDRINWLVGLYYAKEEFDRFTELRYGNDYFAYWNALFGGAFTPYQGQFWTGGEAASSDVFQQEAETIAIFTHNTIELTDQVEATVGLRFTSDEKTANSFFSNGNGSCSTAISDPNFPSTLIGFSCLAWQNDLFDGFSTTQNRTDEEVSGTFKLSYRPNSNLLTYASYARGYKAGGFNLDRAASGITPAVDTSFVPETADAYEVGAKWNNDSGSLVVNGAVFFQEYQDFQLNTFLGTVFVVESIPELKSQGVDLDFRWLPESAEFLTLQGGLTFAETEYGEFDAAGLGLSPRLSGGTIGFAPRWSGSLAATIDADFVGDWDARWSLSGKYTSRYNSGSNLDPQKDVDEMVLLNGRVVFEKEGSPLSLELWSQNLTDEDYVTVAFDTPLQGSAGSAITTFLAPPRTYGATVKAKF